MPIFFDYDPFRALERIQRQMDRLAQGMGGAERYPRRVGVYPLVNLSEDPDHIYVRAELPGVNSEDLDITIQDQQLILRGQRKIATEEKDVNYHRRERESGFFRRILRLPARIDPNKVEAASQNGILTITLSKPEEVKPRQITVKSA